MDDDSRLPLEGTYGDATIPGAGNALAPPGGGPSIPEGGPDGDMHLHQTNTQYNFQRINYVHTDSVDDRMAVDPADFDHLARAVTDNANSAFELHRSVAKITEGMQATDNRLQELTHLVSLVARATGQTSESVTKAVSRSASPGGAGGDGGGDGGGRNDGGIGGAPPPPGPPTRPPPFQRA